MDIITNDMELYTYTMVNTKIEFAEVLVREAIDYGRNNDLYDINEIEQLLDIEKKLGLLRERTDEIISHRLEVE